MSWALPESLTVGGKVWPIRYGYMAALDILTACGDPEMTDEDKSLIALDILYPDFDQMPPEDYREALDKALWFLDCGDQTKKPPGKKLVDWEKDFPIIVAPVNRVLGKEIRKVSGEEDYGIHWWSFVAAYYEIGDCTFAQVVRVRERLETGKTLDKQDREWYRKNRALVDLETKYTSEEQEIMGLWGG